MRKEVGVDSAKGSAHIGSLCNTYCDSCLHPFEEGEKLSGRLGKPIVRGHQNLSKIHPNLSNTRNVCYDSHTIVSKRSQTKRDAITKINQSKKAS
jgi:hypothetical protein